MVNYVFGFNQSETGKYFEWIIHVNGCVPHGPGNIDSKNWLAEIDIESNLGFPTRLASSKEDEQTIAVRMQNFN